MNDQITKLGTAMFSEAFPCNPRPFALGLKTHLLNNGKMSDPEAKRILFTLTGILVGQLFYISLDDIHQRVEREPKDPLQVLNQMEEDLKTSEFDATKWKTPLYHLILAAYGINGDYDSLAQYEQLKPVQTEEKLAA